MPQGKTIAIEEHLLSFHNGEEEGFTFIFNEYFPALSVYAFKLLNDQEWANDIVQEAFINLWKQRDSFSKLTNVKAYLYRIVHNIAVSAVRKQKATDEKVFSLPDAEIISQSTYDNIVRSELLAEIYKLLQTLPGGIAEVIRLYYLEEKGIWEIADTLNIPVNTVKSRRLSGITYLRRLLPGYFRTFLILLSTFVFC